MMTMARNTMLMITMMTKTVLMALRDPRRGTECRDLRMMRHVFVLALTWELATTLRAARAAPATLFREILI